MDNTPDVLVRVESQYRIEKDDVEFSVIVKGNETAQVFWSYRDIDSVESMKKFLNEIAQAIHKVQAWK